MFRKEGPAATSLQPEVQLQLGLWILFFDSCKAVKYYFRSVISSFNCLCFRLHCESVYTCANL